MADVSGGHGARPFDSWRFTGELRHSQRIILDTLQPVPGDPMHIVAPPGSGKTLIGLELAMRQGHRALVLTPTTTIRAQWGRSARALAAGNWGSPGDEAPPGAVSEDPQDLGDLTVLTYQMLSVLETSNPFETLAVAEWERELVEAGRTQESASAWIAELSVTNSSAHRSGLQRRARRLRKDIVRADAVALEQALHPNARALIQRLADHGVKTIVLDECHHLLDHWAIVVHCLVARIRAAGEEPLLVGLTATLPSLEDREEFENYTGLLGEVDYEVPTPAVVKEGNLAPYRDFAWFVSPTDSELVFLRTHEAELEQLIARTIGSPAGLAFLEETLFGSASAELSRNELEQGLAESFKRDDSIGEAAVRMLIKLAPGHPVNLSVPSELATEANSEQRIRVLARFALERLLPDPSQAELWARIRAVLADFGYHLTDRGVRRGRDPIDQVLATSVAKDHAVANILQLELKTDSGHELRAVAILDFAVHGHGNGMRGSRAGALRCFDTVVAAPELSELRPVLVTAQHLRIAARDRDVLVPKLAQLLGVLPSEQLLEAPIEVSEEARVIQLEVSGVGSAAIVAAVSDLVTEGTVRLIVGTRGLLGEGWDCPAINTLIDLSAVATSSSTQQLRGRTLRVDPAWPEKVAHNWTVTSVIEADIKIDGSSDAARLKRKHGRVWGFTLEDPYAIVKGLEHTLTPAQIDGLRGLLAKRQGAMGAEGLNKLTLRAMRPRAITRDRWGIGEPYAGEVTPVALIERPVKKPSFLSSMTLAAVLAGLLFMLFGVLVVSASTAIRIMQGSTISVPAFLVVAGLIALVVLWSIRGDLREAVRAIRRQALPASDYQGAAFAVAKALHSQGVMPALGRANISVTGHSVNEPGTPAVTTFLEVRINGGSLDEQRAVLEALDELFGPVRSPRFLLEIEQTSAQGGTPLGWVASRVARLFGHRSRFLAVPRSIGRRREDAQEFAKEWVRNVGPCTLHEIDAPEKLVLLTRARQRSAAPAAPPRHFDVWA